jgi:hypothetical protein
VVVIANQGISVVVVVVLPMVGASQVVAVEVTVTVLGWECRGSCCRASCCRGTGIVIVIAIPIVMTVMVMALGRRRWQRDINNFVMAMTMLMTMVMSAGHSLEPEESDCHRSEDRRQLRDMTHYRRPSFCFWICRPARARSNGVSVPESQI